MPSIDSCLVIMIFPDTFWLFLKRKLPAMPHPFNRGDGVKTLNYSSWEFDYVTHSNGFRHFEEYCGKLENFVKGKVIAELACGGGGKSMYFVSIGAREARGCDLSEILVSQANDFAKKKGLSDRCTYIVNDATKTPYDSAYFDIVMLPSILEHVSDPEALLREALRICKKGGKIIFNTEGYYHWLGHHLWDALPIPWMHLFTTEKQRVRLYKKAVEDYPDAKERVEFRIGVDAKGRENFDYLNHITLRKLERIFRKLFREKLFSQKIYKVRTFRRKPLSYLGKMPFFREIFHESVDGMLVK